MAARRAMPLGSYLARRSPVHDVDARVKLALLLLTTLTLFVRGTTPVLAASAASLVGVMALSGVGLRSVLRALRPTSLILVFVLLANGFVVDGTGTFEIAASVGASLPGLVRGGIAVVRIVVLLGLALVVSATTTASELTDAVSWVLRPLRCLGLPADDLSMVFSVALRFLPVCAQELDRIVCAQRARGARFDEGGLVRRLRRWSAVLVPLVVALFTHADRLADAMRDRCYGVAARTRLTEAMRLRDVCVLLAGCALCLCGILLA